MTALSDSGLGKGKRGCRRGIPLPGWRLHPGARLCLLQPMPRLPARGEDVRGIRMERRAEKLGQTGRSEPTLASAHSETCPVYLGHSPSPNWRLDPRCVPPSAAVCKEGGVCVSRMIEVWGHPCSPGVVPHPIHPTPTAPPSPGSCGGVNIWRSRHRGIERGCEMRQCLLCSRPAPPSCQRPGAAGTPARAGISNTTVIPQTV